MLDLSDIHNTLAAHFRFAYITYPNWFPFTYLYHIYQAQFTSLKSIQSTRMDVLFYKLYHIPDKT